MGGWLALEIMRHAPERVEKLYLLNTTARLDSKEKAMHRQEMVQKAKNGHFEEVAKTLSLALAFTPSIQEQNYAMFLSFGKEAFIRQEESMLQREDCVPLLPLIKVPTLIIHAKKDAVFSIDDHLELCQNIPGARLAEIDECGHMSPLEAPQTVTSFLRYGLHFLT